jgi:hypothetical protein
MATRTIEWARTRISPATSGVVAATALSVAACTSNQRAVDTRFIAKANAICALAVARHNAHPFPVPGLDPMHPRPARASGSRQVLRPVRRASATTARLDVADLHRPHRPDPGPR